MLSMWYLRFEKIKYSIRLDMYLDIESYKMHLWGNLYSFFTYFDMSNMGIDKDCIHYS